MAYVYNPFTGKLDAVGSQSSAEEVIDKILLGTNFELENPVAEILFDDTSILFFED